MSLLPAASTATTTDVLATSDLVARYRVNVLSSMLNNAGVIPSNGDSIKLVSDVSGNSAVNCLVHNASGVGNSATTPSLAAISTGDFTVVAEIQYDAISGSDQLIVSAPNTVNGMQFIIKLSTQRLQVSKSGVGYNSATSLTNIPFMTWVTVAYTRSGTTGTYYVNGVADGTATDSQDFSGTGVTSYLAGNAPTTTGMKMKSARIYSVALTAPQVLADYNGTVQANCVRNVDFTLAPKLATSFTALTGGTVTINTSGDTGARICGARDLYQGTAANQPILTIAAGGNKLTFDGTNDYLKAGAFSLSQPETVYFVGTAVSRSGTNKFWDGNSIDGMSAGLQTSDNLFIGYAGTLVLNFGSSLGAQRVFNVVYNGASSSVRLNRSAAVTGNIGANNAGGFTLGATATPGNYGNITANEVAIYNTAHSDATQLTNIQALKLLNNVIF